MIKQFSPRLTGNLGHYTDVSPVADFAPPRHATWREFLRTQLAALAVRRRLRCATGDLHALDDRMLKDIGVSRHEVGRVVRFGREF